MKLYCVVVILSTFHLLSGGTQEDYWPVHTACDSDKIQVRYKSCDPIQDVGFTFSSCSVIETEPYLKASILLRQSIDELYIYVDLLKNKSFELYHNEPICLFNFPRFSFCGKSRGEMVTIQTSLPGLKVPLKGQYNFKVRVINQNDFQIGCVYVMATFR